MDAVSRGVLCTLSALVIGFVSFMAWVRAGAEVLSFPALQSCYTKSMKKTTPVKQKVLGRPRTGITPLMGFRADPVIRAAIVRWGENQPDTPSLSEAIRRLVELGLKVKMEAKPVSKLGRRLHAQELATKAIEKIIDPAAPPEERALRRPAETKKLV